MDIVRTLKSLARRFLPAQKVEPGLPDWSRRIKQDAGLWRDARARAAKGPSILIATSVGGFGPGTIVESLLGVALTLRGANVRTLLCDAALPACLLATVGKVGSADVIADRKLSDKLCQGCQWRGRSVMDSAGLPVTQYSELLTDADRAAARTAAEATPLEQIGTYEWEGIAVGEHARAGTLRFFARGQLEGEPRADEVLRRYFEAALLTARAVGTLLKRQRFDAVVFNHGIYVPHGITADVCRKAGVRLVTWNVAYRKSCFIFSHDDTYHHTLLSEPASAWENIAWSADQEKQTMDYLASRLTGKRDWIWFHEKPFEDIDKIAAECGVDFSKPVVGLLTNVFWDAQLHYRANAFKDMLDWMLQTIRWFADHPHLQLLIRIHPAEVRGTVPSRQPILDELRKAFPTMPANVFIIPPESNSSTYAAMYKCDSVLIYGTKTGVELTAVGIPVIVGGEAWIRGKGVTMDAGSPDEYFALLNRLPLGKRLDEPTTRRARKYAYHFFFRRMIPLEFMKPSQVPSQFEIEGEGLAGLLPGASPGLDVICDGILKGSPFVFPAESFGPPRE